MQVEQEQEFNRMLDEVSRNFGYANPFSQTNISRKI